jgi:hypothetical protein
MACSAQSRMSAGSRIPRSAHSMMIFATRHYRSVRSRMPVLSATIFDAVFVGAGFGTCRLGADNRLVAGSSPPSPTTQSCANPEFPVSAEHPRFFPRFGAGVMAGSRSLRETKTVGKRIGALRL